MPPVPIQYHSVLPGLPHFLFVCPFYNSEKPASQHPQYISPFTQSANAQRLVSELVTMKNKPIR